MSRYPDGYFDLAIVDPPYGINAPTMQMGQNLSRKVNGYPAESTAARLKKGRLNQGSGKLKNRVLNRSIIEWDSEIPSPEYFSELFRVSKNQIIFGGNYFNLPPTRCIICWDKVQPWENFSQWEMAWTSFDMPAKMYRISNTGGANLDTKIHPTQKPIPLYRKILKDFATPGQVILDTHMGSQTLRIAAFQYGVGFVGSEINEQYYNSGNGFFELKVHQLITMTNGITVQQQQLF
jgi:site-specific DNA-methyltransferase (adenine-specific)